MQFTTEQENGYVFIRITGDITGGAAMTAFRDIVHERLAENCRVFIVDFSGATWINSVGLGMLISTQKMVQDVSGRMILCSTQPIDGVLTVTRLKTIFEIFETEADVRKALQSSGSA